MKARIGTYLGPLIVTGLALTVAVMVIVGRGGQSTPGENGRPQQVIPETPVSALRVRLESIEITDGYSGMIRPRERFSLGFELAGRVEKLGVSKEGPRQGQFLDVGDRVSAGDVLAQLDDRVLRAGVEEAQAQLDQAQAQIKESNARLEKAQSDMARSRDLRERGSRVITDAEYQDAVAQLAVADAQATASRAQSALAVARLQRAKKSLEDSTLRSPVRGVISQRQVNAGESVTPQQTVMEVIQVDEVLLVVGVPEARVGAIRVGQVAHVELLARDRFGRKRPSTEGRVHQVAEAADQTTGLFEVEIVLPNPQRNWRPGLIALAKIVVDRVEGFRVPMSCAVFRQEETFLFVLDEVGRDGKAHQLGLQDWLEEGPDLVVPLESEALRRNQPFLFSRSEDGNAMRFDVSASWHPPISEGVRPELPEVFWTVVSRGQHRLVDGRAVKLIGADEDQLLRMESEPLLRPDTGTSKTSS